MFLTVFLPNVTWQFSSSLFELCANNFGTMYEQRQLRYKQRAKRARCACKVDVVRTSAKIVSTNMSLRSRKLFNNEKIRKLTVNRKKPLYKRRKTRFVLVLFIQNSLHVIQLVTKVIKLVLKVIYPVTKQRFALGHGVIRFLLSFSRKPSYIRKSYLHKVVTFGG